MMDPNQSDPSPPGHPPIFRTWNQVYALVLIVNAIIIILLVWLAQSYS